MLREMLSFAFEACLLTGQARQGEVSRKLAGWGQIGQGAIALGCIGAAVAGAVALGLPCVIGGAASGAVLNWATQE